MKALLRKIAHEPGAAGITVTQDHRMSGGFDAVYHLDDGRLWKLERETADAARG